MSDKIVQTAGRDALGEFAPDFAHYNDDILFGENWNNTDIDLKTRSIITVVALMSQGVTDNAMKFHLMNAKNHAKKAEWVVILEACSWAGFGHVGASFTITLSMCRSLSPPDTVDSP